MAFLKIIHKGHTAEVSDILTPRVRVELGEFPSLKSVDSVALALVRPRSISVTPTNRKLRIAVGLSWAIDVELSPIEGDRDREVW